LGSGSGGFAGNSALLLNGRNSLKSSTPLFVVLISDTVVETGGPAVDVSPWFLHSLHSSGIVTGVRT
jgi:hypothetical protein